MDEGTQLASINCRVELTAISSHCQIPIWWSLGRLRVKTLVLGELSVHQRNLQHGRSALQFPQPIVAVLPTVGEAIFLWNRTAEVVLRRLSAVDAWAWRILS